MSRMRMPPDEVLTPPVAPVDAHTHLFPPEFIARREMLLESDPWFGHAFASPKAKMIGEDALIASMDNAGYAMSIAVGWPWRDQGLCREHNAYLADVARRFPDRIAWLGIVNPVLPDAVREVARCVQDGASGFGEVNADGQGFDWSEPIVISDALTAISDAGLPLMLHTSEPLGHIYPGKGSATPDRLLGTIEAFPELCFVLAHWGGGLPFYELMPEINAMTQNVVYDSAASTYLYDFAIFPLLADLIGPERILFATDYPVLGQRRFLQRVLESGVLEEYLAAILAGNARRVYGVNERVTT
ncbi:MAG TPA: amidohydrolase family protein [Thermomicrobiales bacterium]|nr:amidohydrolase family protein [Thermomicrobiales bacterium]